VFAVLAALIGIFMVFGQSVYALSNEERAALERQLAEVEAQIEKNKSDLTVTQRERTSLERDVAVLNAKIQAAQLGIKQRDLAIKKINGDVGDLKAGIGNLDSKVVAGQQSLAQILRRTREIDDMTLVELALGQSLTDLFEDIDDFERIQMELDSSFKEIAVTRSDLAARKSALEDKKREEADMLQLQQLQKKDLQSTESEKKTLVSAAKGKESTYQKIIAEQVRTATQIKNALFGLRDGGAIPFGTAYQYAKEAEAKTGVNAALTLGVLRQETNLGENVGKCLVTNTPNKGDGIGKNSGTLIRGVMKPDRDVDPFMAITAELGIDPASQVVSCPQSVGYGGAMGPAQFIPSTWVLYKARLAAATGDNPPNPWQARTAIFATAMLMADNGADQGTRESERRAALRYFAGGNWSKPSYAFYGDGVMKYRDQYQADINVLLGK
jgi:membrane-bound lytic murein transglycosylase B